MMQQSTFSRVHISAKVLSSKVKHMHNKVYFDCTESSWQTWCTYIWVEVCGIHKMNAWERNDAQVDRKRGQNIAIQDFLKLNADPKLHLQKLKTFLKINGKHLWHCYIKIWKWSKPFQLQLQSIFYYLTKVKLTTRKTKSPRRTPSHMKSTYFH